MFQDGGIAPYNNPALILFLLATLPEYGLKWATGPDRLLLVSVGTGSSAAVHPGLVARQVDLAFNAKNLAAVFMNGASTVQDMLCRSVGLTVGGQEIDREFGSRVGADGVGGQSLFTYVRYNADLSEDALRAEDITDAGLRRSLRKLDSVDRIPTSRRSVERSGRPPTSSASSQGSLLPAELGGPLGTPAGPR